MAGLFHFRFLNISDWSGGVIFLTVTPRAFALMECCDAESNLTHFILAGLDEQISSSNGKCYT